MKLICKAKIDAGVPNYRMIDKITPHKNNEKAWPRLPNGKLVHDSFIIVKGELYEVNAKVLKSLGEIFDEAKEVRDGKNK